MSPYLGVAPFVFRARNSAFSAPRICTVEAGCLARLSSDPACAMSRAPTSSPTSTVRLGAIAFMRFFRYSFSWARYSVSLTTWVASCFILIVSSADTSVPMDTSATVLSSSSTASVRMPDRSVPWMFSRVPILRMQRAYCRLSVTILPISGKCHPNHSRTRMAYMFTSLSSSSSRLMACTIIVSTLSGENLSLYRDSECASPRLYALWSSLETSPTSALS
mmetsp:Transcript_167685/g.407580  ORF Transcript_167685/g.407580 Transcript_167685/m.407580 type:complete len:220 (+) Transcript_167685:589-1248(+)